MTRATPTHRDPLADADAARAEPATTSPAGPGDLQAFRRAVGRFRPAYGALPVEMPASCPSCRRIVDAVFDVVAVLHRVPGQPRFGASAVEGFRDFHPVRQGHAAVFAEFPAEPVVRVEESVRGVVCGEDDGAEVEIGMNDRVVLPFFED